MNAVIILKKTTHIDLDTAFLEKVRAHNLLPPERKLLLAVSGGIDSVVLCELCHRAGYSFDIAHCNFQLRGEESERDEKFVVGLGEKYKAEVHISRFDTNEYAASEADNRDYSYPYRYLFFQFSAHDTFSFRFRFWTSGSS